MTKKVMRKAWRLKALEENEQTIKVICLGDKLVHSD